MGNYRNMEYYTKGYNLQTVTRGSETKKKTDLVLIRSYRSCKVCRYVYILTLQSHDNRLTDHGKVKQRTTGLFVRLLTYLGMHNKVSSKDPHSKDYYNSRIHTH